MRFSTAIKTFIVALLIAVASRYSFLGLESWKNEKRTADLCAAVGNFLETGNLREAFEGLEYGAKRAVTGKVCINVLDNGRSYAPNCVDERASYQTVTCKAEANTGVRALVMYPQEKLFAHGLIILWGWIALALSLMLYISRSFANYLSLRILEELRVRIFDSPREQKNFIGRIVDSILSRTGILRLFEVQAQDFEKKIKTYEDRLVSESILLAQKEVEADKAKMYVDKIRKIRHDIRSPLSGLLAVQEALDSSDDLLYSTFLSVVRGLRTLVEKLNNLEAEELSPRLTIVEVVAEQAAQAVRLKFLKRKNVSLCIHYHKEKLSPVFAVPDAFLRIFENLFDNAFDAVSLNGAIDVKIQSDGSRCRIVVEDNGCGVVTSLIPRLFQEGATFGKVGGTGLGLYHAKRTLDAWKGTISCEPRAEGGTRFLLTLPLAQTGVIYKGVPNDGRLIVIDDDSQVPILLKQRGYEVVASATTFEGGQKLLLKDTPKDAITLIDQDLGDDRLGTDLIAENIGRKAICLCTNDFDNPEVVQMAKQVGAAIIPKPLIMLSWVSQEMYRLNCTIDESELIPMHL